MHRPVVFLVTVLLLAVGGCDGIGSEAGDEPNFTTEVMTETFKTGAVNVEQIDQGQYGDIVEGTETVLRNEQEYSTFWMMMHADRDSVPDWPAVDFENQVVVAVVMGERPTGGYSVDVEEVMASEDGNQVRVEYTETVPGDNCGVTHAITSPYVLAAVGTQDQPIQDEDFTFSGFEESRSC